MRTKCLVALVTAVVFPVRTPAQGAVDVVRDINTQAGVQINSHAHPDQFVRLGTNMLFAATDERYGRELFLRTGSGSSAVVTMVADINPGTADSNPEGWASPRAGRLVFAATDPERGRELWVTDGTAAGTQLLADIATGPADSSPQWFTTMGGNAYFIAAGNRLWRTDGTKAGSTRVTTQAAASGPFAVLGSFLYFAGQDRSGAELWKTDGTEAGTTSVHDIYPGLLSSSPSQLVTLASANAVLFRATTANEGAELWRSDGTSAGTTLVRDIRSGNLGSTPRELTPLGNRIVFAARTDLEGDEPWASDGTMAGTVLLRDIEAGPGHSRAKDLTTASGSVYFAATTSALGTELYKTNGTPAGTSIVGDLYPGMQSSDPMNLAPGLGGLVFSADNGTTGREPWRSTTVSGTAPLADINPAGNSDPGGFTPADPIEVVFRADNGARGSELWRTLGLAGSTVLDEDIMRPTADSTPRTLVELSTLPRLALFFADAGNGVRLWKTDGTEVGTVEVTTTSFGSGVGAPEMVVMRGVAYFSANGRLWRSDGTSAGTSSVTNLGDPTGIVVYRNRLYFNARGVEGNELWGSDGTTAGTSLVCDIWPGQLSPGFPHHGNPRRLTVAGDTLYFVADDEFGSCTPSLFGELWRFNGTTCSEVIDICPVGGSFPDALVVAADRLFFTVASMSQFGLQRGLLVVNGASATHLATGTDPYILGVAGNHVYFSAVDSFGRELWRTDGTTTSRVADINPLGSSLDGAGSDFGRIADVHGVAVFYADDGTSGFEPWRSDGTAAGTFRLRDIAATGGSRPSSGRFFFAPPDARRALLAATDGVGGVELWRTDGTVAGTVLHHEVAGAPGADPQRPVLMGDQLLFTARSGSGGSLGIELLAMQAMACSVPYEQACRGSNGLPHISGSGTPFLGNAAYGVRVRQARANTNAIMMLAARPAAMDLGFGCTLALDPGIILISLGVATSASGVATAPLPITSNPGVTGLQLFAQYFVLDPSGAFLNQFALTEGLKILLAPQ